jgi:hypothetical protein
MNKLLACPTWQVFLFLAAPLFFSAFPSAVSTFLLLIWLILLASCVYWLGTALYQKLPEMHDLNINRFHFNLFFPLFYFVIAMIVSDGGYEINQDNYKEYGFWAYIILPAHFYGMYCIFYSPWFIGKAIATIERNEMATFDHYAGNFFLLLLGPLGIRWMHPKVQRIFAVKEEVVMQPD